MTEHGKPVARLVPFDQPRVLDRLIAEGLVSPAVVPKPKRRGSSVAVAGTMSDLIAEQRR